MDVKKRLDKLGINTDKIVFVKEPSFFYNEKTGKVSNDTSDTHVIVSNYILTNDTALESIVDIINSSICTYIYKIEGNVWKIWINK